MLLLCTQKMFCVLVQTLMHKHANTCIIQTLQYSSATQKVSTMQNAQNTLYYAVTQQKCKRAFYVLFTFALSARNTVQQRNAHAVYTVQCSNAQSLQAQIAAYVAMQQKIDSAAQVSNYTHANVQKALQKLDDLR